METINQLDSSEFLSWLDDGSVQLIVTDPPFGTGSRQKLLSTGVSYRDGNVGETCELMAEMFAELSRILTPTGLVAIILDHRAVHHVAVLAENYAKIHGEIIWHFETGSAAKRWWSNKHNTILLISPRSDPTFNLDQVPTTERKAPKPGYESPKRISSVWNINMSTTDPQRVGYPTQKPLDLYETLINVHSSPGDLVIDPFAGSGTILEAAIRNGRRVMANDSSPQSIAIMTERLKKLTPDD